MRREKANILIIDNSPSPTGAYNSIVSVIKSLQGQFSFVFALTSPMLIHNLAKDKLIAVRIPFLEIQKNWRLLFYFPVLILNSIRLQKIIKKQQIKLIHVNDLYNMCGVVLKIFNPQIKLVYHVRLLPSSYAKKLYFVWKKLIEKYADEIICVSEAVASNFKRGAIIFDTIPETTTNQVNTDTTEPGRRFTILYLANYISGKGHRQAIDAYNLALPKIENTRLVFIGGTLDKPKNQSFKNALINYTAKLKLEKHIEFKSFSKQPELDIKEADLMLNFSESESFSMTTLEALVYETPIIATACGGPAEIIENGKSGILVPINNVPKMAQAMVSLINNAPLRTSMVIEGKKRVKKKFDFKVQTNLLHSVYKRLLK